MGGTRLEVFKFGVYVFAPIVVMHYTGVPEFFEKQVIPLRNHLFRMNEEMNHPPSSSEDIHEHMQRLRQRKASLDRSKNAGPVPNPTQET